MVQAEVLLRPAHGHHLVGMLLDVPFLERGEEPQVVQAPDVIGAQADGPKLLPIEGTAAIGMLKQQPQPLQLQRLDLLSREELASVQFSGIPEHGVITPFPKKEGVGNVLNEGFREIHRMLLRNSTVSR